MMVSMVSRTKNYVEYDHGKYSGIRPRREREAARTREMKWTSDINSLLPQALMLLSDPL